MTETLDDLLTSARARQHVYRRHRLHISAQTLRNWQDRGIPGPNGMRVRLRTIRVGSRRLTTARDLNAFLDMTTGPVPVEAGPPDRGPEK